MSTLLLAGILMSSLWQGAARTEPDTRSLVMFQSEAGNQIEAKSLDLASGKWRSAWARHIDQRGAKVLSAALLGDRVGVLFSLGSNRRYTEFRARDGAVVRRPRIVTPGADLVISAGGNPLMSVGWSVRLIGSKPKAARQGPHTVEAWADDFEAASTPDGTFALTQIRGIGGMGGGSAFSRVDLYKLDKVSNRVMDTISFGSQVRSMAMQNSTAIITTGVELSFYQLGSDGFQLLGQSHREPVPRKVFPTQDGRNFYGLSESAVVKFVPSGRGFVRRDLLYFELGNLVRPVLIESGPYLAILDPSLGVLRMKFDADGNLFVIGREKLPPGLIR